VESLRVGVRALVVRGLRDRARFDACWRRWLAADAPTPRDEPRDDPTPPRRWGRWLAIADGGAAVAAAIVVAALHVAGGEGDELARAKPSEPIAPPAPPPRTSPQAGQPTTRSPAPHAPPV